MIKKFFFLAVFIVSAMALFAQEPTLWRGNNMNGSYPDQGLLTSWPEGGPELLWHFDKAGQGFSTPVFSDGKIFLSGTIDSTGHIFILDHQGELINEYPYGLEFMSSYPGSRSSPVVVGDLLYMTSGRGQLSCMQADDGKVVWKKDLFKDFDGKQIVWGYTETVLVDGDVVYCTPGGAKNNVIALNRFNGDLIWSSSGLGETSAYCTPLVVDLPNRKLLVTHTASHILGLDAKNGKLLWSHEQPNQYSVHANTPLYHDYGLFCFSGYGQGGVKLKLNQDGSKISKQWFSTSFDSRMGGAVYHDGHIYGAGDFTRAWQCINWESGEQLYASDTLSKGNVILADGLLFCYSQRGELGFTKADPSGFEPLGKIMIEMGSSQHWAHIALYKGVLYVRHGDVLMAYKVK